MVGSVLGMAQSVVNPPLAAAAVPVAMVSLYSKPGSRRWQWRSMKPGVTTRPVASITWALSGGVMSWSTPLDSAVLDQQVSDLVDALAGVYDAATFN